MTKLKSPLGRVVIPIATPDEWTALTKAMKAHAFDFRWRGGEKLTEYGWWDEYKKETCICLGWIDYEDNEVCCASKEFFKKHNAKFITFKKAMELLGAKKKKF